jgi:hypothetical protein
LPKAVFKIPVGDDDGQKPVSRISLHFQVFLRHPYVKIHGFFRMEPELGEGDG